MTDEHPTARSVRDLEPPDVRDRLDAIAEEDVHRQGEAARARTLDRIEDRHFFGDDCPGGHRAANVAGVDWDDQETADEANAREAAERQGLAAAGAPAVVTDEMVDTAAPILRSLMKSHGAPIGTEAAERWVRDILAAVVPLIRAQVATEQSGWPFDVQVAEALRRLDGSTGSAVALLAGMSRDEIERVGGVTPAEEPVADVHAAFEAGEKGVTERPLSNREFIAAEVERLGLQPKVEAMWAEIENGPPMPPGWCTWHQMVDCAGGAPECREARAGIDDEMSTLVTVDPADLLTVLNQRNGHHYHERPGVWDADNRPEIAGQPCVECAARERLRAALATALEQAQPLLAAGSEVESLEPEHRCVTVIEEGPPEFFIDDHDLAVIGLYEEVESLEPVESPVIDMGFLSLPAELQAEAERAVSEGQERSEEQK